MLIACVKKGPKYGPEYVERLWSGIQRHFPSDASGEFVCFTDKPVTSIQCEPLPVDLPGWWSKLGLYKLRTPLIYFDLDVVIAGNLRPLFDWDGFGIIKDYWLPGFNSSVMKLTGSEGHVFDRFTKADMYSGRYLGDQGWITKQMPDAKTFPLEWFPSYKAGRCQEAVPDGAMAVVFHGEPKMADITDGWVPELWR